MYDMMHNQFDQNLNNTIYIEYCIDCPSHTWCTKHDEAKYYGIFLDVKEQLEKTFPWVNVLGNISYITNKKMIPSLGAFEVKFRNNLVFSKLSTSQWPQISKIISRINCILENRPLYYDEPDYQTRRNTKRTSRPSSQLRPSTRSFSKNIDGTTSNLKAKRSLSNMLNDCEVQQEVVSTTKNNNNNNHHHHNGQMNGSTFLTPTPKEFLIRNKNSFISNDSVSDLNSNGTYHNTKSRKNTSLPPRTCDNIIMPLNMTSNMFGEEFLDGCRNINPLGTEENNVVDTSQNFMVPISKRKMLLNSNTSSNRIIHEKNKSFNIERSPTDLYPLIDQSVMVNVNQWSRNNLNMKLNKTQMVGNIKQLDLLKEEDESSHHTTSLTNKNDLTDEFLRQKNELKAQIMSGNLPFAERVQTIHQFRASNKRSPLKTKTSELLNEQSNNPCDVIKPKKTENNLVFPVLKTSTLRASKLYPTKKKITLAINQEGVHKCRIESSDNTIIKLKNQDLIEISNDKPFALPLIFKYNNEDKKPYDLQAYLDDKPWMRIFILVEYI